MKKYVTAIIKCYVCGNNRMTLHKVATPQGSAYVCDRHNLPEYTKRPSISAFQESRLTREQVVKERIAAMIKEKQIVAKKKVVSAKELGIVT